MTVVSAVILEKLKLVVSDIIKWQIQQDIWEDREWKKESMVSQIIVVNVQTGKSMLATSFSG